MSGINGVFNFSFLDKRAGKKDVQENKTSDHVYYIRKLLNKIHNDDYIKCKKTGRF